MISCNPVKALGKILYYHLYMTSNNPVKGSWLDIVLSFFIRLLDVTKYNP